MKLSYCIVLFICGAAFGASAEHTFARHVTSAELQSARNVGYRAGYEDGDKAVAWFSDHCSSFGGGNVMLYVCRRDGE